MVYATCEMVNGVLQPVSALTKTTEETLRGLYIFLSDFFIKSTQDFIKNVSKNETSEEFYDKCPEQSTSDAESTMDVKSNISFLS